MRDAAIESENQLARLHGIWGVGQLFRAIPADDNADDLTDLLPLTNDADPEIRGQVLAMLGESGFVNAFDPLKEALMDPHPRVRRFAALGLSYLLRLDREQMRLDKREIKPTQGTGGEQRGTFPDVQ